MITETVFFYLELLWLYYILVRLLQFLSVSAFGCPISSWRKTGRIFKNKRRWWNRETVSSTKRLVVNMSSWYFEILSEYIPVQTVSRKYFWILNKCAPVQIVTRRYFGILCTSLDSILKNLWIIVKQSRLSMGHILKYNI